MKRNLTCAMKMCWPRLSCACLLPRCLPDDVLKINRSKSTFINVCLQSPTADLTYTLPLHFDSPTFVFHSPHKHFRGVYQLIRRFSMPSVCLCSEAVTSRCLLWAFADPSQRPRDTSECPLYVCECVCVGEGVSVCGVGSSVCVGESPSCRNYHVRLS